MYRVDYESPVAYIAYVHALAVTDDPNVVVGHGTCLRELTICTERHTRDLRKTIRKCGMTARDAAIFTHDVLAGVHHLHTRGLIHCDIKPENVLISAAGRAILADFDHVQVNSGGTHSCAYAVAYRPPEVHWNGDTPMPAPITPASDMWAVGVLLCDLRPRESPFVQYHHECLTRNLSNVFGIPCDCEHSLGNACEYTDQLRGVTRAQVARALNLADNLIDNIIGGLIVVNPAGRSTAFTALMAARAAAAGYITLPAPPEDVIRVATPPASHTDALCAAFAAKHPEIEPDRAAAEMVTKIIYHTRTLSDSAVDRSKKEIEPFIEPDILAAAWM